LNRGWVVDANVGVKPYLPEDLSEVAQSLFQRARTGKRPIYVPDLFFNECANIFWKNVRRSKIESSHAQRSLRNLKDVNLFTVSSTVVILDALDLALEYDLTAYDATYVALSGKLGFPLVTADERLIGKIAKSDIEVCWLGDLSF
jgi:predicted nucleic acid-binding protein